MRTSLCTYLSPQEVRCAPPELIRPISLSNAAPPPDRKVRRARRARAALPECRAPFPARSQPRCARTPGTSSRSAVNTRVALHNIQHAGASEDRHRSVSAPRTPGAHRVLRRQDVPSLTRAGRRWRCATSAQHALRLRCAAGRAGPISPRAFTPFRPSSCSSGAQGHRSGTSDAAVSTSWGSRIAQRRS